MSVTQIYNVHIRQQHDLPRLMRTLLTPNHWHPLQKQVIRPKEKSIHHRPTTPNPQPKPNRSRRSTLSRTPTHFEIKQNP